MTVTVTALSAVIEAHGVVVYRQAELDDDQLVAFSRLLGDVVTVAKGALADHPEVAPVTRDRSKDAMAAYRAGTFFWHIDGATAASVVGRSETEGRALLDRLLDGSTQPQFVFRHHWRPGDLVIWDNTGLLHRALPYRADSPRLMHRTTIAGHEAVA